MIDSPAKLAIDRYAKDDEEIRPLVEYCRQGMLFEVQTWIAQGRPVNGPIRVRRSQRQTPLEIAVDRGFHSLVQVLLEAGAIDIREGINALVYEALRKRRFDLVRLFVEYGFDASQIDMYEVFASWDPAIMQYFIDAGASLEKGMPLARVLCEKVRTALKLLKTQQKSNPTLQEQANTALRHHCFHGNLKWVSLMIWAGADPMAPGVAELDKSNPFSQFDDMCALEWAAYGSRYEVFELKQIQLDPEHPRLKNLISWSGRENGLKLLERLLGLGVNPNESDSLGCPAIQTFLHHFGFSTRNTFTWNRGPGKNDSESDRTTMKAIHLLVKHGGKWRPKDTSEINSARRSLLNVIPDYTAEFVWLMSTYKASALGDVAKLLSTPKMKEHISKVRRVAEIMNAWRNNVDHSTNNLNDVE